MGDIEKTVAVGHLERHESDDSIESTYDSRINEFSPEEKKKLMWKIDRRLVLTLGFMYALMLIHLVVLVDTDIIPGTASP